MRLKQGRKVDLKKVKEFIEREIPFLEKVGIMVEKISHGTIKVTLPFSRRNLNHFGTYQAGTYFTLAEAGGAALLATVFDLREMLLLTKECHLVFRQPAKRNLTYEGTLGKKALDNISKRLEKDRKTNVSLSVMLLNESGAISAEATVTYYLRKGLPPSFMSDGR